MNIFEPVFDGHGGSKIANFVSKNLHKVITQRPEYKELDYENAIVQVFIATSSSSCMDRHERNTLGKVRPQCGKMYIFHN
jgi:serine/threonine protein phosphatase PrpC